MILLSHNFWLHSKVKILFTSFDLYFKSFSFVDMLVDLFWGFCGLAIHFCDNITWSQTTSERKKAYSWTSPQKPPWRQYKVAIVERFTQDSMNGLSTKKKWSLLKGGCCWEVAIGGGSFVFTKRCSAPLSLLPVIRWSLFPLSLGQKTLEPPLCVHLWEMPVLYS